MPGWTRSLKRLILLLLLSGAAIAGVLLFTVDERTSEALLDVEPIYLALFAAIWLATLFFDATSVVLYTRGTGERLSLFGAIRTTTLRIFFNILTPFGFGGQPFSIVSLTREGIPAGKGSSIVVTKLITLSAMTQIGAIVSFLIYYNQIRSMKFVSTMFFIGGFVGVAFIALLASGFLYPRVLIRTLTGVGRLLHSVRIIKSTTNLKRMIIHEAVTARKSFRLYFSKHLGYFLAATASNAATYFGQLVLLYAILYGLGIVIPFGDAIVLAAILLFLIMFMPTPGAIGFGEAFFVLLYARIIPTYLLGVALVLWRFFFHYLSALFGAISSSRYVSEMLIGKPRPPRSTKKKPVPSE